MLRNWTLYSVYIVILLIGGIFLLDRAMGWMGHPTSEQMQYSYPFHLKSEHNSKEFKTKFETNSWGLRSPQVKKDERKRILHLGDSFTFGWGVESDESFPQLIGNQLDSSIYQTINAGMIGIGTYQYLASYANHLKDLQPNYLIINLYANDLMNAAPRPVSDREHLDRKKYARGFTRKEKWLDKLFPHLSFLFKGQDGTRALGKHPNFIEDIASKAPNYGVSQEDIQEWRKKIAQDSLLENVRNGEISAVYLTAGLLWPRRFISSLAVDGEVNDVRWNNMKQHLHQLYELASKKNIKIHVNYLPFIFCVDSNFYFKNHPILKYGPYIDKSFAFREHQIQNLLKDFHENEHVSFYDLTEDLRKHTKKGSPSLTFPIDIHWNKYGHYVGAKLIFNHLKSNHFFAD